MLSQHSTEMSKLPDAISAPHVCSTMFGNGGTLRNDGWKVPLPSHQATTGISEEMAPGDFVIVDQFVDRTSSRESTFFDGPVVAHVSMADPVCGSLRHHLSQACKQNNITTHDGGTYLVMQGPQFSTRAESMLHRSWGMDIIGMTNMPEAKLAREAEICYATVAMCTDYDCWHEEEEDVSVASITEIMNSNVSKAHAMLNSYFNTPPSNCSNGCQQALQHGIFADLASQDDEAIRPIYHLVERFL